MFFGEDSLIHCLSCKYGIVSEHGGAILLKGCKINLDWCAESISKKTSNTSLHELLHLCGCGEKQAKYMSRKLHPFGCSKYVLRRGTFLKELLERAQDTVRKNMDMVAMNPQRLREDS